MSGKVLKSRKKRGLTPVISAIILSAVVIAVGGAVWAFSQGAMTITAECYAEAVINMTETISERFIIEHAYYNETLELLYLYIFNYGGTDIEVNVTYPGNFVGWREVSSKHLEEISFSFDLGSEIEVGIKVESRRGNDAYYRYVVP